jgi:hypothetical protein
VGQDCILVSHPTVVSELVAVAIIFGSFYIPKIIIIMVTRSNLPQLDRSMMKVWTLPLVHLFLAVGLLAYHVHAEADNGVGVTDDTFNLWTRITSGPTYLTTMDKILFVVVIMLSMELLNWLVHNSGGTYVYGVVDFGNIL